MARRLQHTFIRSRASLKNRLRTGYAESMANADGGEVRRVGLCLQCRHVREIVCQRGSLSPCVGHIAVFPRASHRTATGYQSQKLVGGWLEMERDYFRFGMQEKVLNDGHRKQCSITQSSRAASDSTKFGRDIAPASQISCRFHLPRLNRMIPASAIDPSATTTDQYTPLPCIPMGIASQ